MRLSAKYSGIGESSMCGEVLENIQNQATTVMSIGDLCHTKLNCDNRILSENAIDSMPIQSDDLIFYSHADCNNSGSASETFELTLDVDPKFSIEIVDNQKPSGSVDKRLEEAETVESLEIKHGQCYSDIDPIKSGVSQGSVLSPS
ncbi:hypothetical protein FQA39_LY13318 [Lamprigera yunnana]|nr:hypothetical protein FQA39_LY13318 [Lamprigera yunnana]